MDISSTFWQNQVDLDCFMILIEKVDQKVHQNHATSWEWNHDRIVIRPLCMFCVKWAQICNICCSKWTQLFCKIAKWMNPIVLQWSKVDRVSETFQKPWLSILSKLRLPNYAKAASAVLLYIGIRTQSYCTHLHFPTPFTWRSSQLRRDCVILSL